MDFTMFSLIFYPHETTLTPLYAAIYSASYSHEAYLSSIWS